MRHLLLPAQAWWDVQRFDQPTWQVAAWHDQKVRHIHLHIAKALGKVVALLDADATSASGPHLQARVRDEVMPDVAIYRSQLINLLPDGTALPSSLSHSSIAILEDEPLWEVVLRLSRASAKLAAYLEPREHGEPSPASLLSEAFENLHGSAVVLATAFEVDLSGVHRARLEALLGVSLPASLVQQDETHR
jgi:hypothetical protein